MPTEQKTRGIITCMVAEYAKPIYSQWDKKGIKPPEGFKTWMEYWVYLYGENGEKDKSGL